jgi:hypothetical protein
MSSLISAIGYLLHHFLLHLRITIYGCYGLPQPSTKCCAFPPFISLVCIESSLDCLTFWDASLFDKDESNGFETRLPPSRNP